MKRHFYDRTGQRMLKTDRAIPVCGRDFCDTCGDCLACYWEDPCCGEEGKPHFWVVYVETDDIEVPT